MHTEDISHKLYMLSKQYSYPMADLRFNVSFEDNAYVAVCKHRDAKNDGGTMIAEADTFADLKNVVKDSIENYLDKGYGKMVGLPKKPSVLLIYKEILHTGLDGESSVNAARNCTKYLTKPNGVLKQAYEHETFEGLRALVKKAVRKANLNGKKIVLVLEEILQ